VGSPLKPQDVALAELIRATGTAGRLGLNRRA
jgi:hypothetical protein